MQAFKVEKKRVIREDQNALQAAWLLSRVLVGTLGVLGIFSGIALCLTIVGIPLGLIAFNGCKGMFDYAGGKRGAKCPNCTRTSYVKVEQTAFTCRKCSERVEIEWTA